MPKEEAKGIPSRKFYGDLAKIEPGLFDFIVQRHIARRAGPHFDVRFGDPSGLFSWATRKGLPSPGGRILLKQQPMHSYKYKDFEGTIPEGYGAGTVKKHAEGQILVTKVSPGAIHFTLAHKRYPERFVMLRPPGWGDQDWLLINTTPTDAMPYEKVRYKKLPAEEVDKYIEQMQQGDSIEAKVDGASSLIKLLKDGVEVTSYRTSKETGRPIVYTEKLFGGLPKMNIPPELVGTVLKGETYAVRRGTAASPNGYSPGTAERILKQTGPGGSEPGVSRPYAELARRLSRLRRQPAADGVLGSRGEEEAAGAVAPAAATAELPSEGVHGGVLRVRDRGLRLPTDGEILGPQELGGILNSTLARALSRTSGQGDVRLKTMLYDIQQHGKTPVDWRTTPRGDRRKMLEEVIKHLPPETFHLSEEATTPEDAKKLWAQIKAQQHPLTNEGVVIWPHTGRPMKGKLFEDYDVHISDVFPGEGKYLGTGAGGFTYSLTPGGPAVGRVGTGFSDETRRDLLANPQNYIGRIARIKSQEQFPTGAYRAPAFVALHESYPTKSKIADAGTQGVVHYEETMEETPGLCSCLTRQQLEELGIDKTSEEE